MSQILFFRGSAHWQAERLLPWYVNGTLQGEPLEQVRQHLDTCARCRSEVTELRRFQRACADSRANRDVAPSFERLRQRIDAEGRPMARRADMCGSARNGWRGAAAWLRWTLAGQFLLIFGLGLLLLGDQVPAGSYRTLGNRVVGAPTGAAAVAPHLLVIFDPQLSQGQVSAMLQANQASIVAGPNEAGAYVLAMPAERAARVQAALRATPGVSYVQSLDPISRR